MSTTTTTTTTTTTLHTLVRLQRCKLPPLEKDLPIAVSSAIGRPLWRLPWDLSNDISLRIAHRAGEDCDRFFRLVMPFLQ